MFSRCKPASATARVRCMLVSLFTMSILYMVCLPLWPRFGLRDKPGLVLSPGVDYKVSWLSDDDFRGLDAEKGPAYTSHGGRTTYVAGETWRTFRPYYVATPDGKWHLEVLARGLMNDYALRAYLLAAVPSLVLSVLGLVICLYGLKADSSGRIKENGRAPDDLA